MVPRVCCQGSVFFEKIWPEFFRYVWSGEKTFELRKDDRGFRAGDTLRLREWFENSGYSGREVMAEASYIESGLGLKDGWVIIAIRHAVLFSNLG